MFKTRLYKEHYPLRTSSQVQCLTERECKQLARWVRGFPIEIMFAEYDWRCKRRGGPVDVLDCPQVANRDYCNALSEKVRRQAPCDADELRAINRALYSHRLAWPWRDLLYYIGIHNIAEAPPTNIATTAEPTTATVSIQVKRTSEAINRCKSPAMAQQYAELDKQLQTFLLAGNAETDIHRQLVSYYLPTLEMVLTNLADARSRKSSKIKEQEELALRSIAIISDVLSTAMSSVDEGKLMTTKSEVQAMENIAALRGHISGTKELSSNDTAQIGN